MRQIVLDTETTGLNARMGDRIIEIGCIELLNRRFTGNHFHHYINPERDSEEGALAVHGIANEFLQDKPKFGEIAAEFLDYVRGAELIIHNAAFDVEFLNRELGLLGLSPIAELCSGVIDTLRQARELHPGKKNSLDALCERYFIDHSRRTLHGALLDAELLAEVYLAMTRGQDSLAIELDQPRAAPAAGTTEPMVRPQLIVLAATTEEATEHQRLLAAIDKESKGRCLWRALDAAAAPPGA
ncbi:MAG: DNA polymerase III subunit epsilon [Betaproteobacteria bacterium]|nr:DNA polymerase III subunit epsilon [Betaproteobacteria bacterium]